MLRLRHMLRCMLLRMLRRMRQVWMQRWLMWRVVVMWMVEVLWVVLYGLCMVLHRCAIIPLLNLILPHACKQMSNILCALSLAFSGVLVPHAVIRAGHLRLRRHAWGIGSGR